MITQEVTKNNLPFFERKTDESAAMFKRLFQHVCLIVAAAKEQTAYIYNFDVVQNHILKKNHSELF